MEEDLNEYMDDTIITVGGIEYIVNAFLDYEFTSNKLLTNEEIYKTIIEETNFNTPLLHQCDILYDNIKDNIKNVLKQKGELMIIPSIGITKKEFLNIIKEFDTIKVINTLNELLSKQAYVGSKENYKRNDKCLQPLTPKPKLKQPTNNKEMQDNANIYIQYLKQMELDQISIINNLVSM
jgi:hypothetical protein